LDGKNGKTVGKSGTHRTTCRCWWRSDAGVRDANSSLVSSAVDFTDDIPKMCEKFWNFDEFLDLSRLQICALVARRTFKLVA